MDSETKSAVKFFVGAILVILAITWIIQGNDFFLYKVFYPAQVGVQRQAFENSKSYIEGMNQELSNMQYQYIQADKEHKAALASIILQRVAGFNEDNLNPDLRTFVDGLKAQQEGTSNLR